MVGEHIDPYIIYHSQPRPSQHKLQTHKNWDVISHEHNSTSQSKACKNLFQLYDVETDCINWRGGVRTPLYMGVIATIEIVNLPYEAPNFKSHICRSWFHNIWTIFFCYGVKGGGVSGVVLLHINFLRWITVSSFDFDICIESTSFCNWTVSFCIIKVIETLVF